MPSSARPDPARMDCADSHALPAQQSDPAGLRFGLVAGALGTPAIPIAVTCGQLAPAGAAGIQAGARAAGPRPAARRGPVPAVPDSRRA
jgi:hypothetical protein